MIKIAIIKSKTNNQGVTYEYWVAQPMINSNNKTTSVLMLGYKDKQSREDGSSFIERIKVQGTIDKLYPTGKEIYEFAKRSIISEFSEEIEGDREIVKEEQNWFADAIDDK